MPKPKRPHVASPDEIKFTRDGDDVIIQYADPKVATGTTAVGTQPRSLAVQTVPA